MKEEIVNGSFKQHKAEGDKTNVYPNKTMGGTHQYNESNDIRYLLRV